MSPWMVRYRKAAIGPSVSGLIALTMLWAPPATGQTPEIPRGPLGDATAEFQLQRLEQLMPQVDLSKTPETYPKYQVQLGRVALLRDMINWCIENPVRAEKLDPDGPAMRALEAYIHSERQGIPMNFGKH